MYPQTTYLIQRLKKPTGNALNPFSFGAGGNGKLSEEDIKLLSPIWTFDQMGGSEFEMGAVPEALDAIRKYSLAGKAVTGTLRFQKDVHYICRNELEGYVNETITQLARDEAPLRLREMCLLEACLKDEDYVHDVVGWLELNNYFAFFVDLEMYKQTLDLFKINSS